MKKLIILLSICVAIVFYAKKTKHIENTDLHFKLNHAKLDGDDLARALQINIHKWKYQGKAQKLKWQLWAELYDNSDIAITKGNDKITPKDPELINMGYGINNFKNGDDFILLLPKIEGGIVKCVLPNYTTNKKLPPMSKNHIDYIKKGGGYSYAIIPDLNGNFNEKIYIGRFVVPLFNPQNYKKFNNNQNTKMRDLATHYMIYCNLYLKLSDKDINNFYMPNTKKPFAVF